MESALKKLQKSHWWNNKRGEDHVFIAPWWGAKVRKREQGSGSGRWG
jgi:hypothetical protein